MPHHYLPGNWVSLGDVDDKIKLSVNLHMASHAWAQYDSVGQDFQVLCRIAGEKAPVLVHRYDSRKEAVAALNELFTPPPPPKPKPVPATPDQMVDDLNRVRDRLTHAED